MSYAEREHLRPKVKNIRLSQYVKDRFSEWRVELARTLPSAQDLRGESLRDRVVDLGSPVGESEMLEPENRPYLVLIRLTPGAPSRCEAPSLGTVILS